MKREVYYFIFLALTVFSESSFSLTSDEKLQRVIDVYGLKSKGCQSRLQSFNQKLVSVGEKIFSSMSFSGDNDISCQTCHIPEKHLIDGLNVSVGVAGTGEGTDRVNSKGVLVPRNSFTLVGRADAAYRAYFWDGKIQKDSDGRIVSPFGEHIDPRFSSLLSVAAIMPFLAQDEFLGKLRFSDDNEHIVYINDQFYHERYTAASQLFRGKLLDPDDDELVQIRDLFVNAGIEIDEITLADFGNSLSAFIAVEFSCKESLWDSYLNGQATAISENQKEGALVFYGKGRCAGCHSGNLLSDFDYHSIASPQGGFGVSALGQDLGRADVSFKPEDRYKFRTPPLLDVKNTSPYGHSGQFSSLEEVVVHHFNPVLIFKNRDWFNFKELIQYGKILGQRDDILTYYDIHDETDLANLLEFLTTL